MAENQCRDSALVYLPIPIPQIIDAARYLTQPFPLIFKESALAEELIQLADVPEIFYKWLKPIWAQRKSTSSLPRRIVIIPCRTCAPKTRMPPAILGRRTSINVTATTAGSAVCQSFARETELGLIQTIQILPLGNQGDRAARRLSSHVGTV